MSHQIGIQRGATSNKETQIQAQWILKYIQILVIVYLHRQHTHIVLLNREIIYPQLHWFCF